MDVLLALIGKYYGLDWLTLLFGVSSSFLFSNRVLKTAHILSIVACICGLAVAYISGQTGFVVYNAMLIAINARGYLRGDRRGSGRTSVSSTQPSGVPESAPAR